MNEEKRTSTLTTNSFKISEETTHDYDKRINTFEVKPFNDFFIDREYPLPVPTTNFQLFSLENNEPKFEKKPVSRAQIRILDSCKVISETSSKSPNRKSVFLNPSPVQERKKINSRFFSLMIKYFFVKKFLKKIREISNFRDWRGLSIRHYELLNDFVINPLKNANVQSMMNFFKFSNFLLFKKIV